MSDRKLSSESTPPRQTVCRYYWNDVSLRSPKREERARLKFLHPKTGESRRQMLLISLDLVLRTAKAWESGVFCWELQSRHPYELLQKPVDRIQP